MLPKATLYELTQKKAMCMLYYEERDQTCVNYLINILLIPKIHI